MPYKKRCPWCESSPLEIAYHDQEWGRPVFDDKQLFEALTLEGAQAGLSWSTILNKRENYRKAFDQFNAEKIACYSKQKVEALMQNPGIVRNRLKINSTINNAKCLLKLYDTQSSFSTFLWAFTDGQPIINRWKNPAQVPAETKTSKAISKALKKHGFKFIGPTICYAFMQAIGMVDDHLISCFCHTDNKANALASNKKHQKTSS